MASNKPKHAAMFSEIVYTLKDVLDKHYTSINHCLTILT